MILTHPIELNTDLLGGLTDQQLLDLCVGNKHLKIERDDKGNILIMSPTKFRISSFNSNLLGIFYNWNKKYKKGILTDSNGGYILADSSMRAPDLGFVLKEKFNLLTEEQKMNFAPVCPDFVVEIISSKDELQKAKDKMNMWLKNGCQIAWLIDTFEERIYVYGSTGLIDTHEDFSKELTGSGFLSDFSFIPQEVFSE
ncbi:MAG: Uma2 family endonuclease [Opitutaceae bacterium]|nr:Uma2 family endonuclease [Cytophagales bacterium]